MNCNAILKIATLEITTQNFANLLFRFLLKLFKVQKYEASRKKI